MRRRIVTGCTSHFVALGIYTTGVLISVLHHEAWRDEADAWMASRDLTLAGLFDWTGYAGTPGLWYLLLMPFAKAGFPYITLNLINAAVAIATAALIVFAAPFPKYFRYLVIFSFFFGFQYAVVARPYGLTCLVLFSIAAVYPKRAERPWLMGVLVLLLANTTVHGFFIAASIGMVLAYEWGCDRSQRTPARVGGLAVAALGGVLALWQLYPPADGQLLDNWVPRSWWALPVASIDAFLPKVYPPVMRASVDNPPNLGGAEIVGLIAPAVVIIACMVFSLNRCRRALFILISSLLALAYVFVFKWYGGTRHAGVILVLVLFVLWIGHDRREDEQSEADGAVVGQIRRKSIRLSKRIVMFVLPLTLAVSCSITVLHWCLEYNLPYSGAKRVAEFIRTQGLGEHTIAGFPDPHLESVHVYLPDMKFWHVGRQDYGTHLMWDAVYAKNAVITMPEVLRRINHAFPDKSNLLILLLRPLPDEEAERQGYRLIFSTTETLFGEGYRERYFLYEPIRDATGASTRGGKRHLRTYQSTPKPKTIGTPVVEASFKKDR